jgi:uncharacterized protein YjgD (DUF1641 family)
MEPVNKDTILAEQLARIQQKLDAITDEMAIMRRQRQEMDDLKEDLTRVARDMFDSAVVEFEDIAPFVKTGDFLFLLKKVLRNTNTITRMMERLEGAIDFVEDAQPIGKELFQDGLMRLHELDQKGYFDYLRETAKITDNIVSHFSVEDIRMLADNIVAILETVKKITQPDMLHAVNNAVMIYKNLNTEELPKYSIWKALREMNSPEMQKGLGMMVTFMKNISQQQTQQIRSTSN